MWNSRDNPVMEPGPHRHWSAEAYRRLANSDDLVSFSITVKQTDMLVSAERNLRRQALVLACDARGQIEREIERCPEFRSSLVPLAPHPAAPPVVAAMLEASRRAQVGPMAAVAGAIADHVGCGLRAESAELIVENGGDIFLRSRRAREIALVAEHSALIGLRIALPPAPKGVGIATSGGTIGHSLSFGRADAVMIVAEDAALADALATAIGNIVRSAADVQAALDRARDLGARAAVILADGCIAAWGEMELLG